MKIVLSLIASLMLVVSPESQETNILDWENPEVFAINKLPPRVSVVPYETIDQALAGEWEKSPYYHSLNGLWKFHFSTNPANRPVDFTTMISI